MSRLHGRPRRCENVPGEKACKKKQKKGSVDCRGCAFGPIGNGLNKKPLNLRT